MRSQPSPAAPERARWPRLRAAPYEVLGPLLPRGYAGFTEATAPRHLVIPARASVPLIVKLFDSPYRPPQFVTGAERSWSVVEGECSRSYLEVWLSPLGAYTLLGLPMQELSGRTLDLRDLLGGAGRRLGERLRDAPSWRHRFALLDRFLLRRLGLGPRPSPEVGWAWRRLVATAGAVPIGRLAREVGWSHKHLTHRFRQQVGLSPKTAARLVRFDQVWHRLDEGVPLDWGRVAHASGYADQAHLIRDFREFTGTTPTDFVRRTAAPEVRSVQDGRPRVMPAAPEP